MVYHKTFAAILMCVLFATALSQSARADVTEIQKLRFGRWMVTDNNSSHFITVATNGSYNSSPALINISVAPQPGIYQVDGLPAFHVIGSVVITVNQQLQGMGPDFTLDSFTTSYPAANGAGVTTLYVGATAHTTGTGVSYPNDTYNGELHIEINL